MSIPLYGAAADYFNRFGQFIGAVNAANAYRGTSVGDLTDDVWAAYSLTDQPVVQNLYNQLTSFRSSFNGYLSQQQTLSRAMLIAMAADSAPLPANGNNLSYCLQRLATQMIGGGTLAAPTNSIQANTVSATATAAGTNSGDGVMAISTVAWDGGTLQYIYEENLVATVTNDSLNVSSLLGQEPLSIQGTLPLASLTPPSWTFPSGSGVSSTQSAVDAEVYQNSSGNILNNGDFQNWGGAPASNANVPNGFTVVTGTPGTDIKKGTSPYGTQTYNLQLVGDGATLSGVQQQFGSSSGTTVAVSPGDVVAVCIRVQSPDHASILAGSLRLSLVNASGTVIENDWASNQQFNIDLTALSSSYVASTHFFQLPTTTFPSNGQVYLRIKLSTAITNAKVVNLAYTAACFPNQLYNGQGNVNGGPYSCCFSGQTAFVTGDYFTLAVSNDYGGAFQQGFWEMYNMANVPVRVPATATPTIPDSLVLDLFTVAFSSLTSYLKLPELALPSLSRVVGAYNTAAIDLRTHSRVMAIIDVGDTGSGGTVTLALQESVSGSGGWSNVAGGALSPITANDTQATLECSLSSLNSGYYFIRFLATVSTDTCVFGVETLANQGSDSGTVQERKNLT